MECAICYKKIKKCEKEWRCKDCNNKIHLKCYSEWSQHSQTCPFCREEQTKESSTVCNAFFCAVIMGFSIRFFGYLCN